LKADPNNLNVLLAMGRVAIKSGDAQAGLDPLNRALSLAVRFDNQEQKALILLAMGIAYRVLNKPDEALRDYQQSLEVNRQLGQKRGVASNLLEIAQVQTMLGKLDAALASQKQALDIYRQIGAKKEMGDTLIDIGNLDGSRGQYDAALDAYKQSLQIQRDVGDETYQALCLNNIGNVYLNRGDNDNALTYLQQALQLREKLKVPTDIADTLHNAGEAYANIGQYEQAMSNYMRAIELYRKAGDNVGAAVLSHAMALVFQTQGRYGAALNAIQDALKPLRETGDKSPRMAQFLADFGGALGSVGRMSEASKPLDEADSLARPLKNDSLQAVILNNRADVAFYSGDWRRAKELYSGAMRAAAHGGERETILAAKMNVAKVTLAEGQSVPASELRHLAEQADALGVRDRSVEASVYVAQGMINNKDYAHARETLERGLGPSEKMGLRMQTAKIHYLLGTSLRLSGHSADAAAQYREFIRLLDDMKKDVGAEKLLERADLKSIYEESTRWVGAAKN
jgi:tetratricopeptide (TPR) repeat protein